MTAVDWMSSWAPAGIEGIVSKALADPYVPGSRSWWKTKHRETIDVVVGGLVGNWRRPTSIVAGRFDTTGRLRIVARSAPLSATAATDRADLVRVDPVLVAEVAVEPARDQGMWRHLPRWCRVRPDLTVNDVPLLIRRPA